MITALAVFKINYLHDKGDFLSAKELSESLLQHAGGLVPFHRHELASELLFYEIIGERRRAEIERLRTKELQEHLKQTAAYPSHKRLKYAYELLVNEDRDAAAAVYAEFEKIAREHPFPADTAAEQELIHEYIDKLALTGP